MKNPVSKLELPSAVQKAFTESEEALLSLKLPNMTRTVDENGETTS